MDRLALGGFFIKAPEEQSMMDKQLQSFLNSRKLQQHTHFSLPTAACTWSMTAIYSITAASP